MTVSPFDHPIQSGLLGDETAAKHFSFEAELAAMLAFESALAEAQAENGVIGRDTAKAIIAAIAGFQPDIARLREATARDGMLVPELVRQLRKAVGDPHGEKVHFGATSQDVIDTSLVLRLKSLVAGLDARLAKLDRQFGALGEKFGGNTLMGVTRMQPALPIRAADRIAVWQAPLRRHRDRLTHLSEDLFTVQFGGAVGTLEALGDKALPVRKSLAERLGLGDKPQWHSQRDTLADFTGWLSLVTGSLGKFGQDVTLMALDGRTIKLAGGGGSSAMPHKQNPVQAETLVTLARFNAVQLSGMHQSLVHELERSGSAWTLEWLLLPQMAVATAAALRTAIDLATGIEKFGETSLAGKA
ncbi:3-carboxy-cis,cis-muconate cycloisomerase [Mesorhizobium sp. IMUNJ 23232]|uniref:3-carboxy-cis,cis-muconate cycloisomerase n=1 Tax=Mesorhizobium sp. IMUNJ 23232 TaxID=3376064 RepID=UPI0037A54917